MASLVDDVLVEAFIYLAEKSRQSFSNITATSHVCTRWRKLALACPELWRRFPFLTRFTEPYYGEDFTREILGRCGGLTIDIGWEHCVRDCDKGPLAILKEMDLSHRLRSYMFSTDVNSRTWEVLQFALSCRQAPELQELSITSPLWDTGSDIGPIQAIFTNNLPSLRVLAMTRCYVDLESVQAPRLEELTIENGYPTGDSVHLRRSLLGALFTHANLTRLCIRINTGFTKTHACEHVHMTRLVDLDLAGDFPTIHSFFEHVSAPRLQKLKIKFCGPPNFPNSMEADISDSIGRVLPCLPLPPTSTSGTLSFFSCQQLELGGVFSPMKHTLPFWSRDENEKDVTFIFTLPEYFRDVRLLRIVADRWLLYGDRIQCLELPDDPLAPVYHGDVFRNFILNPSVSVQTIICTPQWARKLVRDGLEGGRFAFLHPPLQAKHQYDLSPSPESENAEVAFEIDTI